MAVSPEKALATIEEWMEKCRDASDRSEDGYIRTLNKGFEAMHAVVSKKSDHMQLQRAIAHLEIERLITLQFDKHQMDENRDLVLGLVECFHLVLKQLTNGRNQVEEEEARDENTLIKQECTESPMEPLDSPNDISLSIIDNPLDDLSVVDTVSAHPNQSSISPLEPIEEYLNDFIAENQVPSLDFMGVEVTISDQEPFNDHMVSRIEDTEQYDDYSLNEQSMMSDNMDNMEQSEIVGGNIMDLIAEDSIGEDREMEERVDVRKDSSATDEVKKRRQPTIIITKPMKFADQNLDVSDDEMDDTSTNESTSDSFIKVQKASSQTVNVGRRRRQARILDKLHYADPNLDVSDEEGEEHLAVKSAFKKDSSKTVTSKKGRRKSITIIRPLTNVVPNLGLSQVKKPLSKKSIKEPTFKRFTKKTRCMQCKEYPSTVHCYISHLARIHKSSLAQNGIYLKCVCGIELHTGWNLRSHKKCDGHQYTLRRLVKK